MRSAYRWYGEKALPTAVIKRELIPVRGWDTGHARHLAQGLNSIEMCRLVSTLCRSCTDIPPNTLFSALFVEWILTSFFTLLQKAMTPTTSYASKGVNRLFSWGVQDLCDCNQAWSAEAVYHWTLCTESSLSKKRWERGHGVWLLFSALEATPLKVQEQIRSRSRKIVECQSLILSNLKFLRSKFIHENVTWILCTAYPGLTNSLCFAQMQ